MKYKNLFLGIIITAVLLVVAAAGCAYFNTFYNAQNYYRQGMKLVVNDTLKQDSEFFDKTIEKSTAVIVKYPRSRYVDDALFMMGASYYYKGDYSRALEKLDFLLANYPESKFYDDALYYKGLAYYKEGKFAQATISLKEAQSSKQFSVKSSIILSLVYFKEDNYVALTEVAKDLLQKRIEKQDRRWLLQLLGDAQFNQRLFPDALRTYDELLLITLNKEEERNFKLKIAETYLEMGEYDKCLDFLKGQEDPEFKSMLADLNVRLGNTKKAKEIYLEVGVSNYTEIAAEAFYKLAELCRGEDSLELAVAYYDSSITRAPMSEYGMTSKKVADVLRRIDALTKETENIDRAQFLLAEIYFVDFNDPERAVLEYEKVHENFPKSEWAPKALYARLWIAAHIEKNDSLSQALIDDLILNYPNSEYTEGAKNMLVEKSSVLPRDEEQKE